MGRSGMTPCAFLQDRECQGPHIVEGVPLGEAGLAVAAPRAGSDVLGGDKVQAQGNAIQGGERSVSLASCHRHLRLNPCQDVVQRRLQTREPAHMMVCLSDMRSSCQLAGLPEHPGWQSYKFPDHFISSAILLPSDCIEYRHGGCKASTVDV